MSNQLSISNVINISVSETPVGLGEYNVNNLAIFTSEVPANSFGTAGYAIYLQPSDVATDFGSTSVTAQMANQVFSQQPNILAGGGYLVVILIHQETQTLGFSAIPDTGSISLDYGAVPIGTFNSSSSVGSIQTAFRTATGKAQATVTGNIASTAGLVFTIPGVYYSSVSAITVTANSLEDSGMNPITPTVTAVSETIGQAITRTTSLVQYFGILQSDSASVVSDGDVLAAAAIVQALNKMYFVVSENEADVEPGGLLDLVRVDGFSKTRGLYYGAATELAAVLMSASYAGRALSVNFNGSNTASTMHLKQLIGVSPDPSMTQTILTKAIAAGADTYVSLQGVSAVFTSGANNYFDQIYNECWLVGALQVAGFNYLAQSATKIPQTEQGMNGLKGAYRAVMQQGVVNQYLAPGQWNSSTTFGNQVDFLLNISQIGYYIYSTPVSQQSQANRVARQAPLIQIAAKQAGAVQESTVLIVINA